METSNRRTNVPEKSTAPIETAAEAAQQKLEQASEQLSKKTQDIQAGVAAASEAAQGLLQAAGEQITECARATDEAIRKHPYQSLGMALGVGFLCGYLLKRK